METKQKMKIKKELGTIGNCTYNGFGVEAYLLEDDTIFLQMQYYYKKVPKKWTIFSQDNFYKYFDDSYSDFEMCVKAIDLFRDEE